MKTAITILTFLARHAIFNVLVMITVCLVWTLSYFILLALAVILNQDLGGPIAYPAGLVFLLALFGIPGCCIFAPASAAGVLFCHRFRLPRLAAIPVVFIVGLLITYVLWWITFTLTNVSSDFSPTTTIVGYVAVLSIPLGIYWWITEGPGALLDTFYRWARRSLTTRFKRNGTRLSSVIGHFDKIGVNPSALVWKLRS